jgi:hypothetical protein
MVSKIVFINWKLNGLFKDFKVLESLMNSYGGMVLL